MEGVKFILERLSVASPNHHDVRVLHFVQENADKDGYLSVQYRYARGASSGRVYSGWVSRPVPKRPGSSVLPGSMWRTIW